MQRVSLRSLKRLFRSSGSRNSYSNSSNSGSSSNSSRNSLFSLFSLSIQATQRLALGRGSRRLLSSTGNVEATVSPKRVSQQINRGGTGGGGGGVSMQSLLFAALFTFIGGVMQQCYANPTGEVAVKYKDIRDSFCKNVLGIDVDEIFLPVSSSPIPVWPTDPVYAQVPPGTPAPILLVLDVEKCIIGSQHDHKYGWRYVKRPGLDKFIKALGRNYFEIALFSETDLDERVYQSIDPDNICHKLMAQHGEVRNGQCCKRLDLMNRDVKKIILIDDNPDAAQLFLENTLIVRPFVDVKDKSDSELLDLIPLLQSLVHHQADDVRDVFRSLLPHDGGQHSAHEAAVEYSKRIAEHKEGEKAKRNKGLGSLLRGNKNNLTETNVKSSIPSAMDLINASVDDSDIFLPGGSSSPEVVNKDQLLKELDAGRPDSGYKLSGFRPSSGPVNKKKGKLLSWVEDAEREKSEQEMRKREKMEEIYQKKMTERQQQQQQEKQ